jgi:hypothetical protein
MTDMHEHPDLSLTIRTDYDALHPVVVRNPAVAPVSAAVDDLAGAMYALGVDGISTESDLVLRSERLGKILDDDSTLIAEGVVNGDVLTLVRRPDASTSAPTIEVLPGSAAPSGSGTAATARRDPRRIRRRGGFFAVLLVAAIAVGLVAFGLPSGKSAGPVAHAIDPTFAAGRYVQLASFRGRRSAMRHANDIRARGIKAHVISSSDVEELYPSWHVVAVGPLPSASMQRRMIRRARRTGFGGGLARRYTAITRSATAADFAGDYQGTFKRVSASHPARNRRMTARVSVDKDGNGKVHYETPTCAGTLQKVKVSRAVMAWQEHIESGDCIDGGRWIVKLHGRELVMTWRHAGRDTWVAGRLRRA